jgi:hypothetical protein
MINSRLVKFLTVENMKIPGFDISKKYKIVQDFFCRVMKNRELHNLISLNEITLSFCRTLYFLLPNILINNKLVFSFLFKIISILLMAFNDY